MKKNAMIRIDENLIKKAKEYGLNISKISENALKDMIERIERPKTQTNGGTPLEKTEMVRRVGFEPTNPCGIGASVLRLWPCWATSACVCGNIETWLI